MRSYGWALIQDDSSPFNKRRLGYTKRYEDTGTPKAAHVKRQEEESHV